jgi:predicted RNase H-like nuclease
MASTPRSHPYVLAFQIRIVGKKLIDAAAGSDLANCHADCEPHSTNAGTAAHRVRALRYTVQICQRRFLLETH